MQERIDRQIDFILEIDRIKQIVRQNYLADGSRRENDAEHSWHLALMAMLLTEHAVDQELNRLKTIEMVLIHDLVEIYAGDTYCYDEAGRSSQTERERAAAARLFAILPEDQEARFTALWEEFEAMETPEARFAGALDRFQPMLLNFTSGAASWREHTISEKQVIDRNRAPLQQIPALWKRADEMIRTAVARGDLIPTEKPEK